MALVRYAPGAVADLNSAFEWYWARSQSAAQTFASRFDEGIRRVQADPLQFAKIYRDFRRCPVEKYPYSIIFVHQPDSSVISVVAVAHAKRRDRYWKFRN